MNKTEAFGLPPGSVRATLALLLVGAAITLTVLNGTVPGELMVLAGIVVRDYFESRKGPKG